jgi:hypothetical protein
MREKMVKRNNYPINVKTTLCALVLCVFTLSCKQNAAIEKDPLFTLMDSSQTGIAFRNDLAFDKDFNIYKYRNFYNGGGVSIGDINNDGLQDIYFTANQTKNKLYLNKGDFKFEDISASSGAGGNRAWSTGVTMVDVNADGLLDIYVCNSGDVKGDNKQNELFINNGDLTFTESADAYGLADAGFTTHASFFDYDHDGDLDAYILNNSYQSIGDFDLRRNERPKRDLLGGDKLMENQNGKFVDVSEKAGIYGSVIGFGLGVTVGDVNADGWDDIYVSNDFFERDYLYINNQNGTFKESLTDQINSISGASMGADMADIDNDARNDIFVTEMLPNDYKRLKTVTTFEDWNRYQYGVKNGYYHQFTRNSFQNNNGNNTFSEVGRFSGVEATDWSWGALIFDMDNDGYKDLFVANGIFKDLTDQDYIQYASSEEVRRSMFEGDKANYQKLVDIIPSNPVSNFAYKNLGDFKFEDKSSDFGLNQKGFSNGSAYGDLDNDGDLDLVVNNVNMPSFIYRNNANLSEKSAYIRIDLQGSDLNQFAVGSKIFVTADETTYYLENQPVRGFQSSMDPRPLFGLKSKSPVDIKIVWPMGEITTLKSVTTNTSISVDYKTALFDTPIKEETEIKATFIRSNQTPDYVHKENQFVDFDVDRSLFMMKSTLGPKMSKGDLNGDGLDDIFIGGSRDSEATILLGSNKGFKKTHQEAFKMEAVSEDAESVMFDADGDGDLDIYVCSGGIEFSESSTALKDRLYFNDGKGIFTLSNQMLPGTKRFTSSSTVAVGDIDGDGDLDLFVGEGSKPMKNGVPGDGFLLENDGRGNFTDITNTKAAQLIGIGVISSALLLDIDGDKDLDLIIVGEFMGVEILENQNGQFNKKSPANLSNAKGWWNIIKPADLDGDGDLDFIIGNHGLNSRFKASEEEPIGLFVKDFDKNGLVDPILARYKPDGEAYPYGLRHNLIDQIKSLKKVLPDYKSFENASVQDIFGNEALKDAIESRANTLASVVLINNGNFNFSIVELPSQAQMTPIYAIATGDFDKDGDLDIVMGGNLYGVKPEIGKFDASRGIYLKNDGKGNFEEQKYEQGFFLEGEIRDILVYNNSIIVSRNQDSLAIFKY